MKAVLVAGGAGYIGAHTCKALHDSGYLPVAIDNLSTGYRSAVKWGPLIEASLSEQDAIRAAIQKYDVVAAMHFAACSLVGESMTNPAKYYENNVSVAVRFVSELIDNNIKNIIFSSTAAVYGIPNTDLISEDHAKIPINAYGETKRAFELALFWFQKVHNINYTILRYFNAAGSSLEGEIGESHIPETHLIPLLCKSALGLGAPLTVFGDDYPTRDGTAIRDYIHVVDLADAHVKALERMIAGGGSEIANVGTGQGVTVGEVIKAAERIVGRSIPHNFGPRRAGDPAILVANATKIQTIIDWKPHYSDIETIINSAILWQKTKFY